MFSLYFVFFIALGLPVEAHQFDLKDFQVGLSNNSTKVFLKNSDGLGFEGRLKDLNHFIPPFSFLNQFKIKNKPKFKFYRAVKVAAIDFLHYLPPRL